MKKVTCTVVFILTAAFAMQVDAEGGALAVDDNEIWSKGGRSQLPLIPISGGERAGLLGQKYNEQAFEQLRQHHRVEALQSFARAEKLLGSSFMSRLARGKLYGELNRWSSAYADFRAVLKASHSFEDDSEILNYLLEHQKNDVALELSKSLDYGAPSSQSLLLKSKILQRNHKMDKAIECAKMAHYLDMINGADNSQSTKMLKALDCQPPFLEAPNSSKASVLWSKLDPVVARGYELEPSELEGLMSSPSAMTGWDTEGNVKIPLNYELKTLEDPIRMIRGSGLRSEQPPTFSIEPNVFRCCLTESDLTKHFGPLQTGQFGGLPGGPPELEPKRLQITKPWGVIMFTLSPGGAHYLQDLTLCWFKRKTANVKVATVSPTAEDFLVIARRELNRKDYPQAKKALFSTISALFFVAKYHSAGAKATYTQSKELLQQVYLQEHKPEIAAYCKKTSYLDLYEVCESLLWDSKRDLPEFSPFAHEKWRVGHSPTDGTFFVGGRVGNFRSPADNALSVYLKRTIPADKMVYGRQVEVERPSPELVDAGVFGD